MRTSAPEHRPRKAQSEGPFSGIAAVSVCRSVGTRRDTPVSREGRGKNMIRSWFDCLVLRGGKIRREFLEDVYYLVWIIAFVPISLYVLAHIGLALAEAQDFVVALIQIYLR